MKSVFFRYFTHTAILVFLSFTILGVVFVLAASSVISAEYRSRYVRVSAELAPALLERVNDGALDLSGGLAESINAMTAVTDCQITVCSIDGRVLYTTGTHPALAPGSLLPDSFLMAAAMGGWLHADPFPDMAGRYETFTQTLISPMDKPVALLLVTGDQSPAKLLTNSFMRVYLMAAALVLVVTFGTAYINSRSLAKPLYDMAACARAFERGDFTARVDRWVVRDDEIGELSMAFNGMADTLERGEELRRGFIGGVSHELKTPMTTISGYIGGILDGTIPPESHHETLTVVRDEVMRLSRLVTGMLELSRHQSGQMDISPKPMDITELATRVLCGMEPKINQKGLSVEVLAPDEPVMILADSDSMTQVLTNLLDNAVKFCNAQGSIGLSISRRQSRAYVVIQNTGPVIPPGDIPFIFDRFHKADRSRSQDRSGLGLGLYLVKSILSAHHEDIFVMSENGMTEFMFSLPEAKTGS